MMHLEARDVAAGSMSSRDFQPWAILYDGGGNILAQGTTNDWLKSTVQKVVGAADWYGPVATSVGYFKFGDFEFQSICGSPSCNYPIITADPLDVTIPKGQTATLALDVNGSSPLDIVWRDVSDPFQTIVGNGPQIVVAPSQTAQYQATVSNCGWWSAESRVATVTVTRRRRLVRHP